MALFTDGSPATIETLRRYESSVLDVAAAEGIDLDDKRSLAAEELGDELLGLLLLQNGGDPRGAVRWRIGLSDIVVTPALRRWHAARTLSLVFRDAYHNQLNDRYQAKWTEYQMVERTARLETLAVGLGMVANPVSKASGPNLGTAAGSQPAATYVAQVTWVNITGQEGAPSDPVTLDVPAGSLLTVQAVNPPVTAVGWNAYVGIAGHPPMLQNGSPLVAGSVWTMWQEGVVPGPIAGDGQTADVLFQFHRELRRG